MATMIRPTVDAMRAEGKPFQGVLYAGVMLTSAGPMLLEYNVRFGDPECQALMLCLADDLADVIGDATGAGSRERRPPAMREGSVVCVVLTAPGYPDAPETGDLIGGLDEAHAEGVEVFHAGTRRDESGSLRSAGGRVLNVVARGATLEEARRRAYAGVGRIAWARAQYRRDVGAWVSP
jgi:phosphoribosylamine--glycine ligase